MSFADVARLVEYADLHFSRPTNGRTNPSVRLGRLHKPPAWPPNPHSAGSRIPSLHSADPQRLRTAPTCRLSCTRSSRIGSILPRPARDLTYTLAVTAGSQPASIWVGRCLVGGPRRGGTAAGCACPGVGSGPGAKVSGPSRSGSGLQRTARLNAAEARSYGELRLVQSRFPPRMSVPPPWLGAGNAVISPESVERQS